MVQLTPLPAFSDNYIWLIEDGGEALVVDPGEARPVLDALQARGLKLTTLLITHHHPDHVGAIGELASRFSPRVIGPATEQLQISGLTELVDDGDTVDALGHAFQVIGVGGHTLGHIAYYAPELVSGGAVFCGDTLFSAGCGRLFEGTPAQMYASLQKLASLPASTAVCCAHEYTLANLAFAETVEPHNPNIALRLDEVRRLRAEGRPSLPSSLAIERRTNPYLRCTETQPRAAARTHGAASDNPVAVFAALRSWKDNFKAP